MGDCIFGEEGSSPASSTVGEVSLSSGNGNLTEGEIITNDEFTPHDTKGLIVKWSSADVLSIKVAAPVIGIDVTDYDYVSFRISHLAKISPDPALGDFNSSSPVHAYTYHTYPPYAIKGYNLGSASDVPYDAAIPSTYASLNNLEVNLIDTIGGAYPVTLNKYIPAPHFRENRKSQNHSVTTLDTKGTSSHADDELYIVSHNLTKSAMITVRIPLSTFSGNGVDLAKIEHFHLTFPSGNSGFVVIDDIEFTK